MDQNEAVEREVALDLVRHGLYIAPAVVLVAALGQGYGGAAAAALGIGVVVCNFLASAVLLGWAARRSPTLLALCAFGGFFVRMAIILVVLFLARDLVDELILAITLVGSHLGLLIWEARSVGLTLAAPGLRPSRTDANAKGV
ncbi:MAG: hypothetical protein ACRDWD_02775 [Acidimicrobiia bacterium]